MSALASMSDRDLASLARAGYPKLAAAIKETIMTADAFSVIPEHPRRLPPPCDAKYDDAAIFCQRDKGHDGDHEGVTWVTWPQDAP